MKKTLYINKDAYEILKTKSNMSRYVSDLIINDSKRENKAIDEQRIVSLILEHLKDKEPTESFKCVPTSNDIEHSIKNIIGL